MAAAVAVGLGLGDGATVAVGLGLAGVEALGGAALALGGAELALGAPVGLALGAVGLQPAITRIRTIPPLEIRERIT
jgi:hypothetical protein